MTRFVLTSAKAVTLAAATLTAALMLATSAPAFATDGPVFKKRHKDDVTIIVIDRQDRNKKRFVTEDKRKPGAATTFKTRDDEIRIRIPRHSKDHQQAGQTDHWKRVRDDDERRWRRRNVATDDRSTPRENPGPKIIVVDRDSRACKGSGVCVIRP